MTTALSSLKLSFHVVFGLRYPSFNFISALLVSVTSGYVAYSSIVFDLEFLLEHRMHHLESWSQCHIRRTLAFVVLCQARLFQTMCPRYHSSRCFLSYGSHPNRIRRNSIIPMISVDVKPHTKMDDCPNSRTF